MSEKQVPGKNGYGVLLLFGLLAGLVVGLLFGEPSAGAVSGFGLAVVATALLWLRGR